MKRIVAIIQARLKSERLPNKVLLKIPQNSGVTCLGRVIERVKESTFLDDIILTTPDKELRKIADEYGIKTAIALSPKRDVLKEYMYAAKCFNADFIVRITADCPLIDPEIIDQCIDEFLDDEVDLVYNTDESAGQLNGEGSDVEVFSFEALKIAYEKAEKDDDREHVTRYMRREMKTKYVPVRKLGIKSLNTLQDYYDICKMYEKEKKNGHNKNGKFDDKDMQRTIW